MARTKRKKNPISNMLSSIEKSHLFSDLHNAHIGSTTKLSKTTKFKGIPQADLLFQGNPVFEIRRF